MALQERPDIHGWAAMSDEQVWAAFRKGNKRALEFVYRKFIQDLYNYGMKIRAHQPLVNDCIQELFVELWHSRKNLSTTRNIKFYLLKALKLKINYHLKQELNHRIIQTREAPTTEIVLSSESLLIQHQLQEERVHQLHKTMKQLPVRQQEILHLLFFEGLSYEEASEILSINVRSVYTLAWKSLSALRKKLIDFMWLFLLFKVSLLLL